MAGLPKEVFVVLGLTEYGTLLLASMSSSSSFAYPELPVVSLFSTWLCPWKEGGIQAAFSVLRATTLVFSTQTCFSGESLSWQSEQ
jgi:hypothetical protein